MIMEAYIIKFTICLAVILMVYLAALEREKMHNFNRAFLLFGLLLSLLIAFLPNGKVIEVVNTATPMVLSELSAIEMDEASLTTSLDHNGSWFSLGLLLWSVYVIGLVFTLIRFGRNIYRLLAKAKENVKIAYKGARLVLLQTETLPHTFLNYIYVNEAQYRKDAIHEKLLAHELAHVTQRHSWDVLVIEFVKAIFWFNPLLIYYKRVMQLNHEFLADEAVNKKYNQVSSYQYLLVDTCQNNNQIYLASNINFQLTKKRLKMMTKKSSRKRIYMLMAGVVPVMIALVMLLGQPVKAQENLKEEYLINDSNNIEQPIDEKSKISNLPNDTYKDELRQWKFMRGIGLKIPRSFSPNGDRKNDWLITQTGGLKGIKDYKLTIYNKYGEVVFESENLKEGWNGNVNNGKGQPLGGVYVYSLSYEDADGLKSKKTGEVTLIVDPDQEIPVLVGDKLKKVKISEYDTLPKASIHKELGISKDEYFKETIVHFRNKEGKTIVKSYDALPNDIKKMMPLPPPNPYSESKKKQSLKKGTIIYLKENGSIVIGSKDLTIPNAPPAPPSPPKSPNASGIIPPPPPPTPPSPLELIDVDDPTITYWLDGKQISKDEMEEIDSKNIKSLNVNKNDDGGHSITIQLKSNSKSAKFSFTPKDQESLQKDFEVLKHDTDVEYILDGKKVDKQTIDDLKPSLIESIEVTNIGDGKKQIIVKSKR